MASYTRRELLRGIGAGSVVCATLWAPRDARASDLSLQDRVDQLYSNRFNFDDRGEPQITVGLMQGQSEVVLEAPAGIRVLVSGAGGTAIKGGKRWLVRLLKARPSSQRFSIVLDSFASGQDKALDRATKSWTNKGHKSSRHEVGALFGVSGRMLDARKTLLTTGDFASEADAWRAARVLAQRQGALGKLHPVIERRASGAMSARDLDTGVTITAEGVLWFEPLGGHPITVENVLHGTTMGEGERDTRRYRGQIYVAIDRHGKLSVVNRVSETELLSGLVPAEIYPSAPAAALEAQAVAARGQLLTKAGTRHLDDPFLLCSEQHCQVYAGQQKEHPRTNAAVVRTRGHLLMRPGERQLVDTVYSANSGGHTEDNDVVWPSPKDPQLRGRPDPLVAARYPNGIDEGSLRAFLTDAPRTYSTPDSSRFQQSYRWQASVDPGAIAGRPGVPEAMGRVSALDVLERGRSGRASRLRLTAEHGAMDLHGELNIRKALGGLRSAMFVVDRVRDGDGNFVLVGGGHGHGVGLCQHGAMGMARAGKSFQSILAHYYRGAKTQKLW